MYCSSFPWRGKSHNEIVDIKVHGEKLIFPASTPSRYQSLAYACMAYKAEQRPTSFSHICEQLEGMKQAIRLTINAPAPL